MTIDRRVRRTRDSLYAALVELMRERDYESIRIADILRRSNVGRSTFYDHFGAKDELLARSLGRLRDELTAATGATDAPSLGAISKTLFRHVDRHRDIQASLAGKRARRIVRQAISASFAKAIQPILPASRLSRLPRDLAVAHLTSSFLCVTQWWLERRPSLSWAEAEALFLELVATGLASEWPEIAA